MLQIYFLINDLIPKEHKANTIMCSVYLNLNSGKHLSDMLHAMSNFFDQKLSRQNSVNIIITERDLQHPNIIMFSEIFIIKTVTLSGLFCRSAFSYSTAMHSFRIAVKFQ